MATRDSDRMDQLVDPAVEALRKLLTDGPADETELAIANVAKGILATWAKLKQTERAQDAMNFAMARELLDKEKLQEYIRLTLPGGPLKELGSGEKESDQALSG